MDLPEESFFPCLFCSDLLIEARVLSENTLQWRTGSATATLQRKWSLSIAGSLWAAVLSSLSRQSSLKTHLYLLTSFPIYSSTAASWRLVSLPPPSTLWMHSHWCALRCTFIPYLAKTFKSNNTWLVSFLITFPQMFLLIYFLTVGKYVKQNKEFCVKSLI